MSEAIQFFLIDHLQATGVVMLVVCLYLKWCAHRSGAFDVRTPR